MAKREIKQVANHLLQQVFLTVEDHIAVMTLHNPPGECCQWHHAGGDTAAVRLYRSR